MVINAKRILYCKDTLHFIHKQIMLETRFASFSALSVDPRVGISRAALEITVDV